MSSPPLPKILLVGESNPYGSDPRFALYPRPRYASGNRLREILGQSDVQYLADHARCNLCDGAWSSPAARKAAQHILAERPDGSGVVLLGAKVAHAFTHPYGGPHVARWTGRLWVLSLPHPSGRNRVWEQPGAKEAARTAYRHLRTLVEEGRRGDG